MKAANCERPKDEQDHERSKDETTKDERVKGKHEFEELSGKVLEAAIAVHRALGPGFLESVYQRSIEVALTHRRIPFERQNEVRVFFEDVEVGMHRLDLIVGNEVVVELKAVRDFEDIHFAQVRSYLKATGMKVGLLLNFNAPTLAIKRIVL